jgi:oligoendopeptidase F
VESVAGLVTRSGGKATIVTVATKRYEQTSWDLSALLPEPSEAVISERLDDLERAVEAFEKRRADLTAVIAKSTFLQILGECEALLEQVWVLGSFGSLWFAADTQSEAALTYKNRIEQILTGHENRILFFSLWWKGLDDEEAAELLPTTEEQADYRHFLEDLRRLKPFTLEERSEQIVNLKDANGIGAVLTLYAMLTNRLEFELEVDGETRTLSRDELMSHAFSPEPERREVTYKELYRVYEGEAKVLAQMYVNRVRDWYSENVELRGFSSPIAVRNIANDIPDAAVETLLDVTSENVGLFQRYFRQKASWLGLDRLRRYDIYAPLAASEREIAYGDAVALVLETLGAFHPLVAEKAERVFADNHVDSELRPGKKGGAFCATVLPSQTPWLLLNYTGRVRDVATLAHELGHAVHSLLAEEHSLLTQHASLPLAETASVFAEMLLTDRLLAEESDPLARRELLASALDDIYATVMRQAYFVRFELAAHDAIRAGKSPEELNEIYLGTLTEQFGDSIELGPEFQREWITVPHIYQTPFYCYSYSFGQLLVLALYQRYKEEGDAFVPGYLKLLAYGGSAPPVTILREASVDITDPEFWRGGFRVVADLLDEIEALQ